MLGASRKVFVFGVRNVVQRNRSFPLKSCYVRNFSNEDLKKTINDINKKYNKPAEDESSETKPGSTDENKEEAENAKAFEDSVNSGKNAMEKIKSSYIFAVDYIKQAYAEMVGDEKESALSRNVQQAQSFRPAKKKEVDEDADPDAEPEEEVTGPNALVVVKEAKNAWEQMKDRLQDSPLIKEIMKNSRHVTKAALNTDLGKGAENVANSVKDKLSDAREFWETSQNPIVYTLSGAWDNISGETDEAIAIKEIRRYDPKFDKDEWAEEVRTKLAPKILKAHLMGDTIALKPWLGEAVYSKLSADIRARKHDGIVFDSNILEIDENQMVLKFMDNGGGAVIVVVYMVQQINCIRNREGEIIEGSETDIRAKFYSMAFQQQYNEEDSTVNWKIVDYEFAGDVPYY